MKFVVPARKGHSKDIINKLKDVGNCMCLSKWLFSFILNSKIFGSLLLFYQVDDYFLKVFVAKPHVDFAELFFSLVYLLILDNIVIN